MLQTNNRDIYYRIKLLTSQNDSLNNRYKVAKKIIRAFRKPAFYEISQQCNLRCEGCYYFEDDGRNILDNEMSDVAWDEFFQAEGERGVSMAYLVGAEPAFHEKRLIAASKNIHFGKIGTNGTRFIDKEVEFRIGISVWGDEKEDAITRGQNVLNKAFKNYQGDPRAIMLYTLSPWNLHTIDSVVQMSKDHGLPLTFSMFSPSTTYLNKWSQFLPANDKFFRLANQRDVPIFSLDELKLAADKMIGALEDFPETVLSSKAYCERITRPGPMYNLDTNGIAINCSSRIRDPLRYHRTDGQRAQIKCCTPDVDCSHCRLYSGGWSSRFVPDDEYLENTTKFEEWLDMIETVGKIFLYPSPL
jgi:hypothetical protein